jgi:hypothetical protein
MTKPDYDYTNWSSVNIYDMLSTDGGGSVLEPNPSYLYDDGDSVIVVPADGFYQIEMSFSGSLKPGEGGIQADTYAFDTMGQPYQGIPRTQTPLDARNVAPLEIHLMKNFDESNPHAELIGSKHKFIEWSNSQDPIQYEEVQTCFPHESFAQNFPCPVSNQLSLEAEGGIYKGGSSSGGGGGGTFGGGNRRNSRHRGHTGGGENPRPDWHTSTDKNYGYVYDDNSRVLAYDPIVCENFIMGFSSLSDGCVGILKNGKSWSGQYVAETDNIYQMQGYNLRTYTPQHTIVESSTAQNQNEFTNSPTNYCSTTANSAQGHATCLIWLNRGDVLSLKAIQRRYTDTSYTSYQPVSQIYYFWDATVNLKIKAVSPKSLASLQADNPYYNMPTQFPYLLNLCEFLSNEMTIASFINGVKEAFNLEILQDNKEITINTRTAKPNIKNGFVNLNDRIGDGAESEKLQLPSEYAVKWKIDEEEFGFVQSVPYEHQEDDDWKDYAEYGYETIKLDSDTYNINKKEIPLEFSYNWYHPFTWRFTTPTTEDPTREKVYSVPVIAKDEWFIDNYK